jgi:hypothetical protein
LVENDGQELGRTEERANYDQYVGERSKKTSMGDILGDKLKAALKPGAKPEQEGQEEE